MLGEQTRLKSRVKIGRGNQVGYVVFSISEMCWPNLRTQRDATITEDYILLKAQNIRAQLFDPKFLHNFVPSLPHIYSLLPVLLLRLETSIMVNLTILAMDLKPSIIRNKEEVAHATTGASGLCLQLLIGFYFGIFF